MLLTVSIILLLAVLLIVLAMTKKMNTIWFPLGAGVLLAMYWVVSDVLPVAWLRLFEDKTESQKHSYYIYAVIDAVGLGGLLFFIMSMTSMTGALVYVACVLMKKRFHDEYLGVSPSEPAEVPAVEEESEGTPEMDHVAISAESEGESAADADLEDVSEAADETAAKEQTAEEQNV